MIKQLQCPSKNTSFDKRLSDISIKKKAERLKAKKLKEEKIYITTNAGMCVCV